MPMAAASIATAAITTTVVSPAIPAAAVNMTVIGRAANPAEDGSAAAVAADEGVDGDKLAATAVVAYPAAPGAAMTACGSGDWSQGGKTDDGGDEETEGFHGGMEVRMRLIFIRMREGLWESPRRALEIWNRQAAGRLATGSAFWDGGAAEIIQPPGDYLGSRAPALLTDWKSFRRFLPA